MEHFFSTASVKPPQRHLHGGYTLIEMLVVLAIIIIIAAIAIAGQSNFSRTLSLNNTAFDIALSIRQAQSYGLSSRFTGSAATPGYGINMVKGVATSYTFYADTYPAVGTTGVVTPDTKPGNWYFDSAFESTAATTYQLNNGFSIGTFCVNPGLSTQKCSTDSVPLQYLDIVFRRPDSDAHVAGKVSGGSYSTNYMTACISVKGPTGETRAIYVSQTGQVATDKQTCP